MIHFKAKIYVAGHRGLVGSAIVRKLKSLGYVNLITRTHSQLDLIDQRSVQNFFKKHKPDYVIIAAAKVGGIVANNNYPADFIYQNLMIETNIIDAAYKNNVRRLLFLGSSCIYPKNSQQPINEDALLTGKLEPTNEPYAISKIAGIKLCESYNRQHGTDFRSVMPTNLYGPGDNYHQENSHVIPGLINRFHNAKKNNDKAVKVWGSGNPKREFLYVDDMADASIHIMNIDIDDYNRNTQPMLSHINIGTGEDLSIKDLSYIIASQIGYQGVIKFDVEKPDGAPRKLLNVGCLNNLGWKAKFDLNLGINLTYKDYLININIESEL
jgi:GDP-L-fucose synthase